MDASVETSVLTFPMPTYFMFGLYLVGMVLVGLIWYKKSDDVETYVLGGRGLGSWVTAMSAQASDMSGWLLMGLPGAVYARGMGEAWIGIGLATGTLFNWCYVASRLRVYTERTNSLTIASYLGKRFDDPTGLIRKIVALITFGFLTVYAGSGLVASGKLFQEMFNIQYQTAVIIGTLVILVYTLTGGYPAVCWTDFFQGCLMFCTLVIAPIVALQYLHPSLISSVDHAVVNTIAAFGVKGTVDPANVASVSRTVPLNLLPYSWAGLIPILSAAVWGLGYFGQPHIITRFMSIKSHKDLPKATTIAMIWVVISLGAAVLIGLLGVPMFNSPVLTGGEQEKVFLKMISKLFTPWIGGIMLAAIMAAIMSTIDSQLLASSSMLSEDIYTAIRKNASEREMLNVNRALVFIITVLAFLMAMWPNDTIFGLVSFAWGGFGAAFGPVVLMSLYSRRMTWVSALAGMIVGTAVMLTWKFLGTSSLECAPFFKSMYEILPGFMANLVTILIINLFHKENRQNVLDDFDYVQKVVHDSAAESK
ncbi:MAG: sodium/proline symporter PutP [Victivallales bacterium]|nr:sodium/proline symporter PutP [Victivallales bacterium]